MTAPVADQLKENPFAIFCPECGKTICYVCAKIDDNIAAEMDGCDSADMSYIRRQNRRRRAHLTAYDHAYIGENDQSTIVMRLKP